jgi:BASS family bile acid:Na+ symporter
MSSGRFATRWRPSNRKTSAASAEPGNAFFLGYLFSRLLRCDELTSRTISVEVGMQNSGLGAALAKEQFAQMPLTALPCAISATFHSVIGSLLAGVWRLRPVRK